MPEEPPVKIYILITFFLFVIVTVIGLTVNIYLDKKFPEREKKEPEKKASYEPEEVKQSKAIIGVAIIIFIMLVIIYSVFKIASRQSKI